jgi:capsular polysaccharide biosynthesis protein
MNEEVNYNETEIELMQLIKIVWRHWWQIALVTLAGLVLGTVYVYIAKDDVYTADSSMIVQVTNSTDSDYTNLMTGQRLVDTYAEISKSDRVMNQLKDDLDLDMSNQAIRNMIAVNSVSDTLIIRLSVTTTDPALSQDIANQLVVIVKNLSDEFEGLEDVEVFDSATLPLGPSGPNRMMYSAIGLLLGGMIGVGLVFLREFLDKKIRTTKDLEDKLGIRVLGAIPYYDMDEVM